jgi:hypothetical protein
VTLTIVLGDPTLNASARVLVFSRPVPFKADITPRFPEAVAMLAGEREFQD